MKKAIKIDVLQQSVTEVMIDDYHEICTHIGNGCELFTCPVQFENEDTLYVDDEGLLHEELQGCFMLEGCEFPIVGNAIILGCDSEGESIDCKSTVEEVERIITFHPRNIAYMWKKTVIESRFVG